MEDIEDILVGSNGGAPPGFRLPVTSVGLKPKKNKNRPIILNDFDNNNLSAKIPGTQVSLSFSHCFTFRERTFFLFSLIFLFLLYFCRRFISRLLDAHTTRQVL